MGYFSNGTEGMAYEAKYCEHCLNYRGGMCPILVLHSLWNYEALGVGSTPQAKQVALDIFIPRNSVENKRCTMFLNAEPQLRHFPEDFKNDAVKLAAWNEGKAIKVMP